MNQEGEGRWRPGLGTVSIWPLVKINGKALLISYSVRKYFIYIKYI